MPQEYRDPQLEQRWDEFLELRRVVSKSLELARADKVIGAANEAQVVIYANEQMRAILDAFSADLRLLFIVSSVEVLPFDEGQGALYGEEGIAVDVQRATGEKCERCWKYFSEMSSDPEHTQICQRCLDAIQS
jgi:isoleucyl-tRNA synthetase